MTDELSYGVVNAGAVRAFNGNQPNRVDSTSVTGAKGQSGTRGRSVVPELTGVRVDPVDTRLPDGRRLIGERTR